MPRQVRAYPLWTVVSARLSRSKPGRVWVQARCELVNQRDDLVLHLLPVNSLCRVEAADGD